MKDAGLSRDNHSVFLPYIHKFNTEDTPRIKATIDGLEFALPVDTGSTGILIGAPQLPNIGPNEGTPAFHYLTSSNILYNGRLVDLAITFHGANGEYATTTVPVLIVDESVVCPWYDPKVDTFHCPYNPERPKPQPRDVSKIQYMGVGFGRNKLGDGQPNAVPSGNPFLNISSINGEPVGPDDIRVGYTISTRGVELGLTEDNMRGFEFASLEPGVTHDVDVRDWAMVNMCFSIDGKGRNCGYGLVDTGISQMYLRTDVGVDIPSVIIRNPRQDGRNKWVKRVKLGTRLSFGFLSQDSSSVAGYTFSVGESSPMAPSYVVAESQGAPPYVNTGRNFLLGYAVAFDATGGRFGFRKTGAPSFHTPTSSSL